MTPLATVNQILGILKASPLFGQFEDPLLLQLIQLSKVRKYPAGEVIIPEGVYNDKVFIIIQGSVVIHAGGEVIVTYDRPGDLIGEMSVISKNKTGAQVSAESEVILFTISDPDIRATESIALMRLLDKVFLDILNYKLNKTTDKAKDFEVNKRELMTTKVELAHTGDQLSFKTTLLNSIFASMSEGVVVTNAKAELLEVNQAFQQMIGNLEIPLQLQEWPSRFGLYADEGHTALPWQELPMLIQLEGKAMAEREIYVSNANLEKGRWLLASASPLYAGDQVNGMVVVFRDETKRKEQQEALIKAKEEAEKTAKAKTNFLSVMSHELKTPLNSVIGMADLLANSGLNPDQTDLIKTMKANGESLLTMVQNILEINQIDAGQRLEFGHKALDLGEFFHGVEQSFLPMAKEKKLAFHLDWQSLQGQQFMADARYLRQMLNNLIHNAIKFTKVGQVTVRPRVEEGQLKVAVEDTGIGIAPDQFENIFTPFGQSTHAFNRQQDGMGVGLALSRKVAQAWGGSILVSSTMGQGSCFTLSLPQQGAVAPAAASSELPLDEQFCQCFPLRILVAEDNAANQKLIVKVLNKLGYQPELADNGLIALEKNQTQDFDLILMDLQMPEMDGVESARQIMALGKSQPPKIVALTANTTAGIQADCQEAGMQDFLTKPLRINELAKTISQLCS